MKIAIVNDMTMAVAALRRVLKTVPEYNLVWVARNGAEAVTKCAQDTPDLILMDLLMPVLDGVEATRQIMKNTPCGILIVTASAGENVAKVYEAMGYGALDAVDTPILGRDDSPQMANDLLAKIATISKLLKFSKPKEKVKEKANLLTAHTPKLNLFTQSLSTVPLVAIGSSTGGPKALATILSVLPTNFEAAITIVQHVDGQFSSGFIDWLNQQTVLPVRLAVPGDRPQKGTILVAGTNDHLYLKPDLTFSYIAEPKEYPYRPSVDVFFKALAENWQGRGTAILLTGMGRDGAEGLSALRKRGWHTIAQSKESCIVYGMPKAAIELNAAVKILSPDVIAQELLGKHV